MTEIDVSGLLLEIHNLECEKAQLERMVEQLEDEVCILRDELRNAQYGAE